jgi:hypothetical protein
MENERHKKGTTKKRIKEQGKSKKKKRNTWGEAEAEAEVKKMKT